MKQLYKVTCGKYSTDILKQYCCLVNFVIWRTCTSCCIVFGKQKYYDNHLVAYYSSRPDQMNIAAAEVAQFLWYRLSSVNHVPTIFYVLTIFKSLCLTFFFIWLNIVLQPATNCLSKPIIFCVTLYAGHNIQVNLVYVVGCNYF